MSKDRRELREGLADIIREAERYSLPARGVSMGASFSGVEGLVLRGIRHARPGLGSVVLFRRGERWVAHRVIARRRGPAGVAFLTRGDANPSYDLPWVEATELLAQVVGVVRNGVESPWGLCDRLAGAWHWLRGAIRLALRMRKKSPGLPEGEGGAGTSGRKA